MKLVTEADAILALAPNAVFCITKDDNGDDLIIWESEDIAQPSNEAIQAKLNELRLP